MRGQEIIKSINEQISPDHCFVKWWRKENDFLDYDLLDRFMQNAATDEEIGGLQLLTLNDMWNEVMRVGGTRVKFIHDTAGDKIEWVHKGKYGVSTHVCAYTPETLLEIFDVETEGNPVDS